MGKDLELRHDEIIFHTQGMLPDAGEGITRAWANNIIENLYYRFTKKTLVYSLNINTSPLHCDRLAGRNPNSFYVRIPFYIPVVAPIQNMLYCQISSRYTRYGDGDSGSPILQLYLYDSNDDYIDIIPGSAYMTTTMRREDVYVHINDDLGFSNTLDEVDGDANIYLHPDYRYIKGRLMLLGKETGKPGEGTVDEYEIGLQIFAYARPEV